MNNIKVSIINGIHVVDSSINGLGGCPFAPGAPGNVATESVVKMLYNLGYNTDIHFNKLLKAKNYAQSLIN